MQLRDRSRVKGLWEERDSQRQKVYTSEKVAWNQHPADAIEFPEMDDVTREVLRILNSRRVWNEFPFMSPGSSEADRYEFTIYNGAGGRCASGGSTRLSFPRPQRKRWVILHEIAHMLHAREQQAIRAGTRPVEPMHILKGYTAAHGWRFCMIYLKLVLWFIGRAEHDALRRHFKGMRVRYRPPRQLSPEQRLALANRLRRLRGEPVRVAA